jgi:DNA-binding cell septation regulator SpoVG
MKNKTINLKRLENSGALKAFASVSWITERGEISIKSFRVIEGEGSGPWVGFPQIVYRKNGQTKYFDLLELSKGLKAELTKEILEEYENSKN